MEKELEKMKMEMKVGEKNREEESNNNKKVRMLLNEIEIERGIEEINMVNKERGVAMVKLENMETKKKVMKEIKIAYEERKKGCKVWVKYGRLETNGKWWKWDEKKGVMSDAIGRERNPVEQERLSGEEE
ncbi:hypothetical protein PV326_011831, partial [Microctonus aethiopoides]